MKRSAKAELALRFYRGSVTHQDVDHHGKRYKLINVPYYHAAKIATVRRGTSNSFMKSLLFTR